MNSDLMLRSYILTFLKVELKVITRPRMYMLFFLKGGGGCRDLRDSRLIINYFTTQTNINKINPVEIVCFGCRVS